MNSQPSLRGSATNITAASGQWTIPEITKKIVTLPSPASGSRFLALLQFKAEE
jgi:hypothetical protein